MANQPDDTIGKQAIAATVARLGEFPDVEFEQGEDELTVKGSPDGFDIVVQDEGHGATIEAGHWHDHFSEPDDVAKYVVWLLSPRMRICVTYRGKHPVKSVVESRLEDGKWIPGSTFGTLFPLFGKKRIEYLSNTIVGAEEVPVDSSSQQ